MNTKITIPNIGEIEIDSDSVPEEWADDSYSYYMNVEPPYKGESPGEDNYLSIDNNGQKILVFSTSHPGAICMYINELIVDMYCVYDCENIQWTYGGMPYGCMEWGCSSINDMPSFCQDILSLFIECGIVLKLQGNPVGEYYVILNPEEYFPLENRAFRRKQAALWAQIIEPSIEKSCKEWLKKEIITLLENHARMGDVLGDGDGFWYESSLVRLIGEKSEWAKNVLLETVNDYIQSEEVTLYTISGFVNVLDRDKLLVPIPPEYICTNILFSKNQKFKALFEESDWVKLCTLFPDSKNIPWSIENLNPISIDFYIKGITNAVSCLYNGERYEYVIGERGKEPIVAISNLRINRLNYKVPVQYFGT